MTAGRAPEIAVDIAVNYARVREAVDRAAERAGRRAADVLLLAVSKTHPADALRAAVAAGATDLGENYVQELRAKQAELTDLPVRWHFIGHLQRNKAKDLAGRVALIHSIDSADLASALAHRVAAPAVQEVLIEVNLAAETSKSGVPAAAVEPLLDAIRALPTLRCTGLMTIPPPATDNRPLFRRLAALARHLALPQLSMGMSDDFETAIQEGATIVRIGTAIFGART